MDILIGAEVEVEHFLKAANVLEGSKKLGPEYEKSNLETAFQY